MRARRLLLLVLILLALAAGLAFAYQRLRPGSSALSPVPPPERAEDSLLRLEPASLDRFTIHHPRINEIVRIEKGTDGVWRLSEPLADWAEPAAIRSLLEALYERDWSAAPPAWKSQSDADLGLAPAELAVEARARDGATQVLRVGAADLMSRWRAATLDGRRLRVGEGLMSRLDRATESWRDHRILPLAPPAIQTLRWAPAAGPAWELRRSGDDWRMLEPYAAPLDPGAGQLLERMLGARALQLELSPLAERPPQAAALGTLTFRGSQETYGLVLHPDGAIASHRNFLLSWDPEDFGLLFRDPESLRSRRVLDLDPGTIVSIRLEIGAAAAEFRRSPGGWTQDGSADLGPEERGFVDALLREGARLEAAAWQPRPAGEPAGRVIYSISRTPREQPGRVLCWWTDETGRVRAGAADSDRCTASDVNFDLAGRALLRRLGLMPPQD